jgi:hypothetical protein
VGWQADVALRSTGQRLHAPRRARSVATPQRCLATTTTGCRQEEEGEVELAAEQVVCSMGTALRRMCRTSQRTRAS